MGVSSDKASVFTMDVDGNPNLRLCSVLLNGFNYITWSRAVMLALGGRSKLGFINGTIRAPEASDPKFEDWFCKDQLVMSWLLNSMEPQVAEIFSFSDSAHHLWESVQEMYGQQNNAARIFQLKKDIAGCYQDGKPFIEHLGKLKSMWNELSLYRPHTTDSATLLKRAEEDKIFQLLASLDQEYEDLRSHILMSAEIPSLNNVCTTIHREEIRKKVMNMETKTNAGSSDSSAFVSSSKMSESKSFKSKKPNITCSYCGQKKHTRDRCWVLHPHLKPKFSKDKGSQNSEANAAVCSNPVPNDIMANFTSNPSALLGQFATYLQQHGSSGNITQNGGASQTDAHANIATNPLVLLGHFASFLQHLGKSENSPLDGTVASGSSHIEDDW